MYKKMMKSIAIACLCWFSILIPCVVMIASGTVTVSISNFAVDSNDRIYIGKDMQILVYDHGKLVDSITPPTSRGYTFTITDEDNILLSTASYVYLMDTNGNILAKEKEDGTDTFNHLHRNRNEFISSKGDSYRMTNRLFRTTITKNGAEIVYQISVLSVVVKLALVGSSIGMAMFVIIWLEKHGLG